MRRCRTHSPRIHQLAVVFVALALAVALVVVRARTPQEVPVDSS
jgi:hypothetical protein